MSCFSICAGKSDFSGLPNWQIIEDRTDRGIKIKDKSTDEKKLRKFIYK